MLMKIKVLYLSNLIYSKGILHLMDAILKLDKNRFSFNIAGDFIGDNYMSKSQIFENFNDKAIQIKNHGYDFNYFGVVSGQKKMDLLNGSDIFILPTFYKSEAIPVSISEAINSGCVIIVTDWKYLKYYTKHKAYYISPKSVNSIVKSLSYMSDKKNLEQSLKKITSIEKMFNSKEEFKKQIKQILNKYMI